MSKKKYQMPSMKVVALRHQTAILQSSPSGVEASRSSYGNAETHEWDSE